MLKTVELMKQIESLREEGKTKAQCKDHAFVELEKRENSRSMDKFWIRWNGLIEAIFHKSKKNKK